MPTMPQLTHDRHLPGSWDVRHAPPTEHTCRYRDCFVWNEVYESTDHTACPMLASTQQSQHTAAGHTAPVAVAAAATPNRIGGTEAGATASAAAAGADINLAPREDPW